MCKNKKIIIDRFNNNVKGLTPDTSDLNENHDGKEGYWLESKMEVPPNGDNKPDLLGYEMKNQTTSGKITFGDWSADEYIFISNKKVNTTNEKFQFSRNDFLKAFGKENAKKDGRLSWSGTPCPTYFDDITIFGQHLTMDEEDNIIITYNFSKDKRENKAVIVPLYMQIDNLILAKWKHQSLKLKLERKFNQSGWFTCIKNAQNAYENISFGAPMNYESWIQLFKQKVVFFDSGMYMDAEGKDRPYSQWRAVNSWWNSLITERY